MHILVFCFSGRNLGALFEVLCVGLNIMNLNLLWCYFSTNSWLDRSERIVSVSKPADLGVGGPDM